MHAVLGLAASHLELLTGVDYHAAAISHRILAIQGSNEAIKKGLESGTDADALMASCYALTFQSTYMSDGLLDFLQMARACNLLSTQLNNENMPMSFGKAPKDHFRHMKKKIEELPLINSVLVLDAELSVTALAPLCNGQAAELLYQMLIDVIHALKVSSIAGNYVFLL